MGLHPPNPLVNPYLTVDQNVLVSKVLGELHEDKRKLYDSLTKHEQEFILKSFIDVIRGDHEKYQLLWEIDFIRKPVSIETFIEDKEYFGVTGRGLFPCWRRELEILFTRENLITEVVVTGAIGTGKTSYATVALAYKIY